MRAQREQQQKARAMGAQRARQPANMAGMAAAAYVGFTAEAANARRLAAAQAEEGLGGGFNFAQWGARIGGLGQEAIKELARQGRLPVGGGGIGARPPRGIRPRPPITSGTGASAYARHARIRLGAQITELENIHRMSVPGYNNLFAQPGEPSTLQLMRNMITPARQFGRWLNAGQVGTPGLKLTDILRQQLGVAGGIIGSRAQSSFSRRGRHLLGGIGDSFAMYGKDIMRGNISPGNLIEYLRVDFDSLIKGLKLDFKGMFMELKAPAAELNKQWGDITANLRGTFARTGEAGRALGSRLAQPFRTQQQSMSDAEYIKWFGKPPPHLEKQLAANDEMQKLLEDQLENLDQVDKFQERILAKKAEDMTSDELKLAYLKNDMDINNQRLRIMQQLKTIGKEEHGLFMNLAKEARKIGGAFETIGQVGTRSFRNIMLIGGSALAMATGLALKFGSLATSIKIAGVTSQNTGASLHNLATGFQALTGIKTVAADFENFERQQRAVIAGMQIGERPSRRLIIMYSKLGMTLGQTSTMNARLYAQLQNMDLGMRELAASTLGIPPAIMQAIAAGYSWNEAQRVGVRLTQDQIEEGHQLNVRMQALKNSYQELFADVGPAALEFLIAFKEGVFPIVKAMANWVANNRSLAIGLVTLGATLAGMIPILKMYVMLRTAGMAANAPMAIGLLAAAVGVGILGTAITAKLTSSMNKSLEDAMTRANERTMPEETQNTEEAVYRGVNRAQLEKELREGARFTEMTPHGKVMLGLTGGRTPGAHVLGGAPDLLWRGQHAKGIPGISTDYMSVIAQNRQVSAVANREERVRELALQRMRDEFQAARISDYHGTSGATFPEGPALDQALNEYVRANQRDLRATGLGETQFEGVGANNIYNYFYGDTFASENLEDMVGFLTADGISVINNSRK